MFNCLDGIYLNVKSRLKRFISEEGGDVNIVSIVVLIGIAVVLAGLFRKQISELINTLFHNINQNAQNAIGSSS